MALREINDLRPKIGRNEYRNGEKALKLGFWQLLFEGKVVYLVHNYNGRLHSWAKVFFFLIFYLAYVVNVGQYWIYFLTRYI